MYVMARSKFAARYAALELENARLRELVVDLFRTLEGLTGNADRALKLARDRYREVCGDRESQNGRRTDHPT